MNTTLSTPPESSELSSRIPDDFVILEENFVEWFSAAAQMILKTGCSQVLDSNDFTTHLNDLSTYAKKLPETEKNQLKPLMLLVYGALRQLQENITLDLSVQFQIAQKIASLKTAVKYLSDDLFFLTNFAEIGLKIAQESPQGKLLIIQHNNFVIAQKSTSEEQENVLERLKKINKALKNSEIVRHLTNNQLTQMKLVACWLMVGYLSQQPTGLDLVEFNFDKLFEINRTLQEIINSRIDQGEAIYSDGHLRASFESLSNHINKTLYFSQFWQHEKGLSELKTLQPHIHTFLRFLVEPTHTLPGLIFRDCIEDKGLTLFQIDRGSHENPVYVMMLDGRDRNLNYYNIFRSPCDELRGAGHAPIIESLRETRSDFDELLRKNVEVGKPYKLIMAGFGMNGAVGQTLAYLHAINNPAAQLLSCCVGTSPYLDEKAVESMKRAPNLYSLNFQLVGDIWTQVCNSSYLLVNTYCSENWNGIFPVYNRDRFWSDFSCHTIRMYCDMIARAVKQPIQMSEIFHELAPFSLSLVIRDHEAQATTAANIASGSLQ